MRRESVSPSVAQDDAFGNSASVSNLAGEADALAFAMDMFLLLFSVLIS
jgi:hypothetical protein